MPRSTPADNTLTFEEIPLHLRPAMAANYVQLLDEGFLAEHITFRRYGDVLRTEATYPDGRTGTSRPANPRPAAAAEAAINPATLDRAQRAALCAQRKQQFAELEGIRVRASWPGGHERFGVLTRHDRHGYMLSDVESLLLNPGDPLPALEPLRPQAARGAAAAVDGAA